MTHRRRSRIETRTRLSFLNSAFLKNPALPLTILLDISGGRGLCFNQNGSFLAASAGRSGVGLLNGGGLAHVVDLLVWFLVLG